MLISAVLSIFIFPKTIAIVALSVLIISDVFAALVGRKFGKRNFLDIKNKSWEGSIAFFVSALLVSIVYGFIFDLSYFYFIISFFASISAAMGEALAKEVLHSDDNLTIPISFGITMWFGNTFLSYFYNISFIIYIRLEYKYILYNQPFFYLSYQTIYITQNNIFNKFE